MALGRSLVRKPNLLNGARARTCPLSTIKRTSLIRSPTSANDPKADIARRRGWGWVGRRNAGIGAVIWPNGELHAQSDGHIIKTAQVDPQIPGLFSFAWGSFAGGILGRLRPKGCCT